MIKSTGADPIHERPAKPTADELCSVHGELLRLERTATNPDAAGAFHSAVVLLANALWPAA